MTAPPDEGQATRLSSLLAVGFASGAVLIALTSHLLGGAMGVIAVLIVAVGILTASRSVIATGTLLLVAATVLVVLSEGVTIRTLAGFALAVVGWDAAEYAIGLGEQVGRSGATARQELRNSGVSIGVATGGVGIGWVVLTNPLPGIPLETILFLAVGCLFLFVALWS